MHPQFWPEDLDYAGKRVVVIGSGATAMTLVPAMAADAGHVTMLQRSPTYVVSRPAEDVIANRLRRVLPDKLAYDLTRRKNVALQQFFYGRTRTQPEKVKAPAARTGAQAARRRLRRRHPLHAALQPVGPAPVPGPGRRPLRVDHVRPGRRRHRHDRHGHRDAAMLLDVGAASSRPTSSSPPPACSSSRSARSTSSVDGEPVDFAQTWTYKGFAYSDVPNLASSFGYINASWTLRADLTCEYVCRLLNHMDATGTRQCTPRLRPSDRDMPERPWIEGFSSGYIQRVLHLMPKQGDREPWINPQSYKRDQQDVPQGPRGRRGHALHAAGRQRACLDTPAAAAAAD